jgi:hypothetical protein
MKTLAALLIALTTTAQATVIHLHGSITNVEGTPPIMPQVGDPFTGTLVFNPDQPFDQFGLPNVSLDVFITTMLGTFSYTNFPPATNYSGGFGPSIFGELTDDVVGFDVFFVEFLSADLRTFTAGITWWQDFIGGTQLGAVEIGGTATVPESASTFTIFALGLAGVAMLPWMRKRPRRLTAS